MKKFWALTTALALSTLILVCGGPAFGQEPPRRTLHDAATGKLKPAELPRIFNLRTNAPLTKKVPFISNGTIVAAREALEDAERGPRDPARNLPPPALLISARATKRLVAASAWALMMAIPESTKIVPSGAKPKRRLSSIRPITKTCLLAQTTAAWDLTSAVSRGQPIAAKPGATCCRRSGKRSTTQMEKRRSQAIPTVTRFSAVPVQGIHMTRAATRPQPSTHREGASSVA